MRLDLSNKKISIFFMILFFSFYKSMAQTIIRRIDTKRIGGITCKNYFEYEGIDTVYKVSCTFANREYQYIYDVGSISFWGEHNDSIKLINFCNRLEKCIPLIGGEEFRSGWFRSVAGSNKMLVTDDQGKYTFLSRRQALKWLRWLRAVKLRNSKSIFLRQLDRRMYPHMYPEKKEVKKIKRKAKVAQKPGMLLLSIEDENIYLHPDYKAPIDFHMSTRSNAIELMDSLNLSGPECKHPTKYLLDQLRSSGILEKYMSTGNCWVNESFDSKEPKIFNLNTWEFKEGGGESDKAFVFPIIIEY